MSKDDYPPVVQGVPFNVRGADRRRHDRCQRTVCVDGCVCHGCGVCYTVDLEVPDELWAKIKPSGASDRGGLLCGSCIMARIETLSGFCLWRLVTVTKLQETCRALWRRLERLVGRHRITPRQLAKRIERGESYRLATRCADCFSPIYEDDDDVRVCIQCGGRNRRLPPNKDYADSR